MANFFAADECVNGRCVQIVSLWTIGQWNLCSIDSLCLNCAAFVVIFRLSRRGHASSTWKVVLLVTYFRCVISMRRIQCMKCLYSVAQAQHALIAVRSLALQRCSTALLMPLFFHVCQLLIYYIHSIMCIYICIGKRSLLSCHIRVIRWAHLANP